MFVWCIILYVHFVCIIYGLNGIIPPCRDMVLYEDCVETCLFVFAYGSLAAAAMLIHAKHNKSVMDALRVSVSQMQQEAFIVTCDQFENIAYIYVCVCVCMFICIFKHANTITQTMKCNIR